LAASSVKDRRLSMIVMQVHITKVSLFFVKLFETIIKKPGCQKHTARREYHHQQAYSVIPWGGDQRLFHILSGYFDSVN
jgi:hypothetical protein